MFDRKAIAALELGPLDWLFIVITLPITIPTALIVWAWGKIEQIGGRRGS